MSWLCPSGLCGIDAGAESGPRCCGGAGPTPPAPDGLGALCAGRAGPEVGIGPEGVAACMAWRSPDCCFCSLPASMRWDSTCRSKPTDQSYCTRRSALPASRADHAPGAVSLPAAALHGLPEAAADQDATSGGRTCSTLRGWAGGGAFSAALPCIGGCLSGRAGPLPRDTLGLGPEEGLGPAEGPLKGRAPPGGGWLLGTLPCMRAAAAGAEAASASCWAAAKILGSMLGGREVTGRGPGRLLRCCGCCCGWCMALLGGGRACCMGWLEGRGLACG